MEDLKEKEKINIDFFKTKGKELKLKYPHSKDMTLQKKIALKTEFQHKYESNIRDIIAADKNKELCNYSSFELNPHQQFIKNFMSPHTPYNGLLLYHGMGSGKTCSAIGITEQYRKYNKYNEMKKKIYIIASPNVQENFKLQLFDEKKLKKIDGLWNIDGCVGEALLAEIKNFGLDDMEREQVVRKIRRIINKHYEFMGYVQFANQIQDLTSFDAVNNASKRKIIRKKMQNIFDGAMVVIDEVHNVRLSGNNDNKKVAKSLMELVFHTNTMKLLFLSGTPMYNDPTEIVFLLNILNMNDGYTPMGVREIFDSQGQFKVLNDGTEIGKDRLIEKANGYVSFVRGENPFNFPFKIFPHDYESVKSSKHSDYIQPTIQFNNKQIEDNIQNLDLYVSELSEIQNESYNYVLERVFSELKTQDIKKFESMDSFGYTLIQEPLNSLNISYIGKDGDESIYLSGKQVIQNTMRFDTKDTAPKMRLNYEYITDDKIFSYENIGNYSAKIKNILDCVLNSTGIVLIYSQYLDAGLVPIALALEELGLKRLGHNNLMKEPHPQISEDNKSKLPVRPKYAMITGDMYFSHDNSEELRMINKDQNKYGDICKVVLISQAGSEGIDFKNLRQVHVLEPWYNLNRIEQVIGRAIRNCSHKELPLEERNTQIFMHVSKTKDNKEPLDTMIYRYSEKKSIKIGKVQKVLKSISIDCLLNDKQNEFYTKMDQTVPITLSDGGKINFSLRDKAFSSICDYSDVCTYQCIESIEKSDIIDNSTIDINFIVNEKLIRKIKHLFRKGHIYDMKTLYDLLVGKNVQKSHVDFAITFIVNEKEVVVDKNLSKGNVIQVKDLYIFKPIELQSSEGTIYEYMYPLSKKVSKLKLGKLGIPVKMKTMSPKSMKDGSESIKPKSMNKSISIQDDFIKMIEKYKALYKSAHQNIEHDGSNLEDNYYVSFKESLDLLNGIKKKKITSTQIDKMLVEHMVETMSKENELHMINYLFKNEHTHDDFEKLMYEYYSSKIMESNGIEVLPIFDLKTPESPPKFYVKDKNDGLFLKWKMITKTQLHKFGSDKINTLLDFSDTKYAKIISFMGYYATDRSIELRTRSSKGSSKGALFYQKGPATMIKMINDLLGSQEIISKGKKVRLAKDENIILTRMNLIIIFEILCKMVNIETDEMMYIDKIQNYYMNPKKLNKKLK